MNHNAAHIARYDNTDRAFRRSAEIVVSLCRENVP